MPIAALTLLLAANLLNNLLAPRAYVLTCVATAGLLLLVARRDGCSWPELGLGRASVRPGLRWSAALVGVVLVGVAVAAALPVTRPAFVDARASGLSGVAVLWRALVRIPLGTALLEEVAFRGVLYALLARRSGVRAAVLASSLLFGLWHVLPSLGLRDANAAVGGLLGPGPLGAVVAALAAVVGTGAAGVVFCELRRRSRAACWRRSRCTGASTASRWPSRGRWAADAERAQRPAEVGGAGRTCSRGGAGSVGRVVVGPLAR